MPPVNVRFTAFRRVNFMLEPSQLESVEQFFRYALEKMHKKGVQLTKKHQRSADALPEDDEQVCSGCRHCSPTWPPQEPTEPKWVK